MARLGENIRKRRESLNMTQDELAERVGYKERSSIAKIENGNDDLTQSKIKAFALALSCLPTDIMEGVFEEKIKEDAFTPLKLLLKKTKEKYAVPFSKLPDHERNQLVGLGVSAVEMYYQNLK